MKKLLAGFLAVVMLVSLCAAPVSADELPQDESGAVSESVEEVSQPEQEPEADLSNAQDPAEDVAEPEAGDDTAAGEDTETEPEANEAPSDESEATPGVDEESEASEAPETESEASEAPNAEPEADPTPTPSPDVEASEEPEPSQEPGDEELPPDAEAEPEASQEPETGDVPQDGPQMEEPGVEDEAENENENENEIEPIALGTADYAVLYSDGTLVFQQGSRDIGGHGGIVSSWSVTSFGGGRSQDDRIKVVDFAVLTVPESTSYWFYNYTNLTKVMHAENLNLSHCTNMDSMFSKCYSLVDLDPSSWDTRSVTNMRWTFSDCLSITSLDLSGWDTSKVTNMSYMVNNCDALKFLDISGWDTRSVASISRSSPFLNNCPELTTIKIGPNFTHYFDPMTSNSKWYWLEGHVDAVDFISRPCPGNMAGTYTTTPPLVYAVLYNSNTLVFQYTDTARSGYGTKTASWAGDSSWLTTYYKQDTYTKTLPWYSYAKNITKVVFAVPISPTNTAWWFAGMDKLATVENPQNLNMSNVVHTDRMFQGCKVLTSLDVSSWDVSHVTHMHYMFSGCSSLGALNVANWNTNSCKNLSNLFNGCSKIKALAVDSWKTGNVENMYGTFCGCSGLTSLNVSGWDTSNVTRMDKVFYGCSGLTSLSVNNWDTSKATRTDSMFYNCSGLTSLTLSGTFRNMPVNENMDSMFKGCTGLTTLNAASLYAPNVTTAEHLFSGCSALRNLDMNSWTWNKLSDAESMFENCSHLQSLDVGDWAPSLSEIKRAFYNCSSLQALDVSKWNVNGVRVFNEAFYGCSGLKTLSLFRLDTSHLAGKTRDYLAHLENVFQNCSSLTTLDVAGWNTSGVASFEEIFSGCSNLTSIDLTGWTTAYYEKVKSDGTKYMDYAGVNNMFAGCNNLMTLTLDDGFEFNDRNHSLVDGPWYNMATGTKVETGKLIPDGEATWTRAVQFSVTVPTTMDIHLSSNGAVTVATDAAITNNSWEPVTVQSVTVTPLNNWTLADYATTTFGSGDMDRKALALQLNGHNVPTNGVCDDIGLPSIPANGGQVKIPYQAKVPVQSTAFSGAVAKVVFTIGWA